MKRIDRIRARMGADTPPPLELIYSNGERRPMGILEAVKEIATCTDVVDVYSEDETTDSLLRAIIQADDNIDDIEELWELD